MKDLLVLAGIAVGVPVFLVVMVLTFKLAGVL